MSDHIGNAATAATIIPFRARQTNTATPATPVAKDIANATSADVIQIYVNIESDEYQAEVRAEHDAALYADHMSEFTSDYMAKQMDREIDAIKQMAQTEAQQRLANALANLGNALSEQKEALARWKESLAGLKSTMSGLGDSYQKLHDNLSGVQDDLGVARDTSSTTIKLLDDSGLTKPE